MSLKPSEVIFESFKEWAESVFPQWRYLEKREFDLLMTAFTGGFMMSAKRSTENARIKEQMDLMANVEVSKERQ